MEIKERRKSEGLRREREALSFVQDVSAEIAGIQSRIARCKAVALAERPPEVSIDAITLAIRNSRHRFETELQRQGRALRESSAVLNVRLAFKRALQTANSLRPRRALRQLSGTEPRASTRVETPPGALPLAPL